MGAGEVLLDNGALKALSGPALGMVPEGRETEPALKRFSGVETLRAPRAAPVSAVRIAQSGCECARFKPLLDIGRDDGVAPQPPATMPADR